MTFEEWTPEPIFTEESEIEEWLNDYEPDPLDILKAKAEQERFGRPVPIRDMSRDEEE